VTLDKQVVVRSPEIKGNHNQESPNRKQADAKDEHVQHLWEKENFRVVHKFGAEALPISKEGNKEILVEGVSGDSPCARMIGRSPRTRTD